MCEAGISLIMGGRVVYIFNRHLSGRFLELLPDFRSLQCHQRRRLREGRHRRQDVLKGGDEAVMVRLDVLLLMSTSSSLVREQ